MLSTHYYFNNTLFVLASCYSSCLCNHMGNSTIMRLQHICNFFKTKLIHWNSWLKWFHTMIYMYGHRVLYKQDRQIIELRSDTRGIWISCCWRWMSWRMSGRRVPGGCGCCSISSSFRTWKIAIPTPAATVLSWNCELHWVLTWKYIKSYV